MRQRDNEAMYLALKGRHLTARGEAPGFEKEVSILCEKPCKGVIETREIKK